MPATTHNATPATAAARRRRTVGSVVSAASSAVMEGYRFWGSAVIPRNSARRIHPGTEGLAGGGRTSPVVTLVMSAWKVSPANGR